ncbi:TRAP transporter small permease subunit [Amylibacter sp. IMCC11727]|uniref:TRAP transporter small permease subunit n=1 Tax=Amylibacter sp. IMCC11727 TaxID=3039851 RepID=UPI00244DF6E8|nr:TRAP transporter small permease subunit [Amylibacter sp. IMCC11727]WGI20366.1 TRAP transporter small permease subunit [Amylibacter sp. IMCC11727]
MASDASSVIVQKYGSPAPLIRLIGWTMLAVLAAFLINNVLNVGFEFPHVTALFDGNMGALVPALIYVIAIALAFLYVLTSSSVALRWDAHIIHKFNVYLIRACFWSVFLVGIADTAIAFLRVENLWEVFVSSEMASNFKSARFVGGTIHIPLIVAGFVIAIFTRTLGFTWLALLIVAAELAIVITRFVFSYEQAFMGDLVRYWYAALFLFASAYTLFEEGHVRVDVLYAGFKDKTRGMINAVGSLALGATTCWVILGLGLNGKQSMINSPVMNFEVTQSGSNGLYIKYQMAAFLGIFAITMLIQFTSYFLEAVANYRNEPGQRTVAPPAH